MAEDGCLVSFYHYVRDANRTAFPELRTLPVADFIRQLDWLERERQIIDYATFETALLARTPLPRPSALLTFDDGFVDHYETVYRVLKARGLSGVFFVAGLPLQAEPRMLNVHKTHFLLARLGPGRFADEVHRELGGEARGFEGGLHWRREVYRYDESPEVAAKHLLNYGLPFDVADGLLSDLFRRHMGDEVDFARALYLSPATIHEMAANGMTFGFHTENHRVLSRLSYEEQCRELGDGVALVQRLTAQVSVPLCYPYGHEHTYNGDTLAILQQVGYATAFNTVRRAVCFTTDQRYQLPRFDARDLPPLSSVVTHA